MRSPAKESRHPNQGPSPACKKRTALGGLDGSPSKKQQKKPSKKDRRRVSFAPDPELTLVHHFVKDDDYSDGQGRVVVQYDDEDAGQQWAQPDAQHPALADDNGSGYRPGFWNKTVPENSPLSDMPAMESPGMVSMELTMPTMPVQQQMQQSQAGEVTAGLPSLGALAEADELEEEEAEQQHQGLQGQQPLPGEVTAGLPSLGALAEADEWEDQQGMQQHGQLAAAANLTGNITAALPGLGDLVEEDEDATAGMDLTVPAGRVLEHNLQHHQPSPAPAAAAPSAVAGALARAASSPAAPPQQQVEQEQRLAAQAPGACHPALAPPQDAPAAAAELEPTARVTLGRLSNGSDEQAQGRAAKVAQLNKWGFAPGQEDTLDINLEMHGRMIMGDKTFNGLYCDNTTGDSRYERPAAAGDDIGDSLLLSEDGGADDAAHGDAASAPPPSVSRGSQPAAGRPSPAPQQRQQQVVAAAAAGDAPNWAAPAFLPPYMHAPANSAPSDHPALVHSPNASNSSLNTLETRRVSVDLRRMSVNSRRFSMQDATGRLLADDDDGTPDDMHTDASVHGVGLDDEQAAAPASVDVPVSAGRRTRRRSSGAAFLGRDVTEKLLVDDSIEDDVGPLADLKRQMRMLSQGSPVLAAAQQAAVAAAAAAAQQVAAEEDALLADREDGGETAAAVAPAGQGAARMQVPAAKTPRTAVSLGYADSHNPATMRLLRSGGTTRLLQETVRMQQQQQQQQLEDEEMEEYEEQGQAAAALAPAARAAAEQQLPDGGITGRTNGTTKLLADLTMASMVGAKLLGRPAQGTPDLPHAPSNDGLTDFSLDEFERPPELPAGQHSHQYEDAMEEGQAVDEDMLEPDEHRHQQQHLMQQAQQAEEYASPALPPAGEFGAGYPMADLSGGVAIPGGPRLARTPVPARATSQPRSAHGTPHSNARSLRSQQGQQQQQQYHQQATPGTHGGTQGKHRLARTPGGMRPAAAAAYLIEADVTAENAMIPGGPKLARTPMGRTPATGYLPAPGSAMAQHHPGSGRVVQFAAGPGSAAMQRYPGSAVALHRGGMTPQFAPPPMTFQDFAKLTEVQFLDNLRRGASINYADLQPNPVPQNLADSYRLLTIISPQVTTLENGIRILQEEVQARRVSAADAEQLVGQVNPAAFQKVQQADDEGLDVLREHVGLLKKVCRQKAVYCLKDVRRQMEESRGGRLQRNLEALQGDLAFAQGNKEQLEAVASAAEQYIADQHRRMTQEDQALQEEGERRTSVVSMRRAMSDEAAANEQRRQQLQEVQERVAMLRGEHAAVSREREALRSRTDAVQVTLMQSQGQGTLVRESSPQAILKKLEDLDVLKACVGWQLDAAQEDPVSGEVALRLGDVFRLRLNISRAGAFANLEVLPEEECKLPADHRALLAALAGCLEGLSAAPEVRLADASAAKVAALVQATTARLSRVADLAAELDGLRLAYPGVADVTCSPDGSVVLAFVNLDAEVKFAVRLDLPGSYPLGPVRQEAKICFDGDGQITEQHIAQAVAAAGEAPGRLRGICREISELARDALPRPALAQDMAFHSNWQNPLFGSTPALSA